MPHFNLIRIFTPMPRYIAFLRAINVGGRVVKMDDLKKMLAMPGIKNLTSYIQSGNLAFDSTENEETLTKKIETKLLKTLGYEVNTFIKTIPQLEAIVKKTPYKKHAEDMAQHVSFLSAKPDPDAVKALLALQTEFEQFTITGTEAYILVKKGAYGETKFSNTFLEKKLKVAATTRNWATVNKMISFGEAHDDNLETTKTTKKSTKPTK
jgi:uncharacterized protein (DUF1697 family)